MEKLSNALETGLVAKLRNGVIVLVFNNGNDSINGMCNYTFINETLKIDGSNYSESGIYNSTRYDDEFKNDIVAVYKIEPNSLEAMRLKIKNYDDGKNSYGINKVWETPKEIEIDFDTLLRAMDGTLIEWLMTPNEIAERVNDIIKNPDYKNNSYFINELKQNIPALKDAESFYVEKEPGEYW